MQKEIKHLRKKFFILSVSVSFAVIFIMLFILNFLMQMSAQTDTEIAADMVIQTAYANVPGVGSETISLKNVQRNPDGNIPILRDPSTIESITLSGEMFCSDENELWYSGGGGIYFGLPNESGDVKYINKEYKFNRDNTKITVDFIDNSNFMIDGENVETDIAFVSKDAFYISPVWWTASSRGLNPDNVSLELYSIEIQYLKNRTTPYYENHQAIRRSFNDLFSDGLPQALSNTKCFYCITDDKGNYVEINSGNLSEKVKETKIMEYVSAKSDTINIGDISYNRFTKATNGLKVYAFVHNSQWEQNRQTLIWVSVISGGGMLILVTLLIYFVSGRAVKPISESMKKQKKFISNVSHELKTPITVISATTELMERKNGADTLAECIRAQTEKMAKLVNEMLTLTRLSEAQKQTSDFRQFDISEMMKKSVLYFEALAFEEEKKIKADIDEKIEFVGMPEKIDNLIGILLDNAIKYSDEKSVIGISLKKERDNAVIICKNPCSDFDEKGKNMLFERFYRGDESHSGEKEGFGLGLSIAKEITDLHGGKIQADYKNGNVIFKVNFKSGKNNK